MPKIYLSPSTQDWNMYVTGSGSEEYNMNLLADALVPYLLLQWHPVPAQPAGDDRRLFHPGGQPGGIRPVSGPPLQRRPGGPLRRGAGHHRLLLSRQRATASGRRS